MFLLSYPLIKKCFFNSKQSYLIVLKDICPSPSTQGFWMGAGEVVLTRKMDSVVHSTSGPHYLNGNCLQETTNLMPFLGLSAAYYHFKGQTEIIHRDKQGCCDRIICSRMTCRISTTRTSEHGIMTLHLFFYGLCQLSVCLNAFDLTLHCAPSRSVANDRLVS